MLIKNQKTVKNIFEVAAGKCIRWNNKIYLKLNEYDLHGHDIKDHYIADLENGYITTITKDYEVEVLDKAEVILNA